MMEAVVSTPCWELSEMVDGQLLTIIRTFDSSLLLENATKHFQRKTRNALLERLRQHNGLPLR